MSEDVQQDTDHLNDTQRKSLVRMSSMPWWDLVRHDLTVNITRYEHKYIIVLALLYKFSFENVFVSKLLLTSQFH